MKYIIDGLKLNYCGFDGRKEVLFFTKEDHGSNRMIEIPYAFDGVICNMSIDSM